MKDKYPNLTLSQVADICEAPWKFLKQEMASGELETVRFKYFGTFQVYPKRAEKMLESAEIRFKKGNISPKQYFRIKEMLTKFLDKNGK